MHYKPKETKTVYLSRWDGAKSRRRVVKDMKGSGWKGKPMCWMFGGVRKFKRIGRY